MSQLTAEAARELLEYRDGKIFNRVRRNSRAVPGEEAGSPQGNGYIGIKVNGVRYKAHRLAWLLVYGEWPKGMIDHINGNRSDNRIENLRVVTSQENQRNQRLSKKNRSGFPGVRMDRGRWRARVKVDGRHRHIGYFDSKEQAVEARRKAQKSLGFSELHGARPLIVYA